LGRELLFQAPLTPFKGAGFLAVSVTAFHQASVPPPPSHLLGHMFQIFFIFLLVQGRTPTPLRFRFPLSILLRTVGCQAFKFLEKSLYQHLPPAGGFNALLLDPAASGPPSFSISPLLRFPRCTRYGMTLGDDQRGTFRLFVGFVCVWRWYLPLLPTSDVSPFRTSSLGVCSLQKRLRNIRQSVHVGIFACDV